MQFMRKKGLEKRTPPSKPCVEENCDGLAICKGRCKKHYNLWLRFSPGEPWDTLPECAKCSRRMRPASKSGRAYTDLTVQKGKNGECKSCNKGYNPRLLVHDTRTEEEKLEDLTDLWEIGVRDLEELAERSGLHISTVRRFTEDGIQ